MLELGLGLGVSFGGAPSKAFKPTDLGAALLAWWRADLGVSGSGWADQSGNGNDLAKTGTPTFSAADATLNNQPSFTYGAGTTQKHQSGLFGTYIAQPFTLFIVGALPIANTKVLFDNLSGSCDIVGDGTHLTIYNGVNFNTAIVPPSPGILLVEFNGASTKAYIDAISASATGDAGTIGGNGVTLGNGASGSFGLGGPIAEGGVVSGLMSLGDRAGLTQYLGARYAIAIGA